MLIRGLGKIASFTIRGAGWGHGWGMSQYGAYGPPRKGLSWKQILAFYYRGTRLTRCRAEPRSRSGSPPTTTTACGSCRRAASPSVTRLVITTPCPPGRNTRRGESVAPALATGSATGPAAKLCDEVDRAHDRHLVVLHSFQDRQSRSSEWSVRPYRGTVALIKRGAADGRSTTCSWRTMSKGSCQPKCPPPGRRTRYGRRRSRHARTVRLQKFAGNSGYDMRYHCLSGLSRHGSRDQWRQCGSEATSGTIVTYRGVVALTHLASSNGGHSARGDYPPRSRSAIRTTE